MEDNIVIRAENLSKVYRLYASPLQLVLDKLGFGRLFKLKPGAHAALDHANINIRRGEKVAIIGRNGAGKSTFLKLVSGVSEPTSGSLAVNGKIHALLSIGSGFHQDFTGRQNVYAYLANQGIAGSDADRMLEEIIEFAEIEDYIDQPLRTYSTGMGVRLMFATSTAIAPDILILDEVLGVGDSYFAQKSAERMREMATGHGTTLLLVTHDIYSATALCERVIWLDRGRVLIDGPAKDVVAAYENSIKVQEEERLRIKNMRKPLVRQKVSDDFQTTAFNLTADDVVVVEIKPGNGKYFEAPFWVKKVALYAEDEIIAVWSAQNNDNKNSICHEGSQWGELNKVDGCNAIEIKDYGNPYQKAALRLKIIKESIANNLSIKFDIYAHKNVSVLIHCIFDKINLKICSMATHNKPCQWHNDTLSLKRVASFLTTEQNFYGTTDILLTNLRCFENDRETLLFEPEKPWEAQVDYEIKNPNFYGKFEIMIVFQKDGLITINRSVLRDIEITIDSPRKGTIYFSQPWLSLGRGEYHMSVSAVAEKYCDTFGMHKFYSIDPNVFCARIQWLKFKVDKGPAYANQTAVVLNMQHHL